MVGIDLVIAECTATGCRPLCVAKGQGGQNRVYLQTRAPAVYSTVTREKVVSSLLVVSHLLRDAPSRWRQLPF